jgi:hypothetical protein
LPLSSFPRKRESRFFSIILDPRLRGGDGNNNFLDTLLVLQRDIRLIGMQRKILDKTFKSV